jgi:anti-sigma B factor antagonist
MLDPRSGLRSMMPSRRFSEAVVPERLPVEDLRLEVDESRALFTVVTAAGEFDAGESPALRTNLAKMIDHGRFNVVIDLSEVQFIDSTGLGVLVQYHKLLHAEGGQLRVVVTGQNILRIFDLTGLTDILFLFESLEAALVP